MNSKTEKKNKIKSLKESISNLEARLDIEQSNKNHRAVESIKKVIKALEVRIDKLKH